MGPNAMQLLLDKFIAINKVTYQDRPSAVERLDQVTVDNIEVVSIDIVPENENKRIARLESQSLMIDAVDQEWECATLLGPVVLNFTVDDTIEDLDTLLNLNVKGVYKYNDGENVKVAQIVLTNFVDYTGVLNAALDQLEDISNYRISVDDVSLVDTTANGWVVKINSNYLSGEMLLVRFDESKIIKGNWALGYLGQVLGKDLITTGSLASLVGLGTSRTITPDSVWLKFSYYGQIMYIAQKTVVNQISYNNLITAGLINRTKLATIGKDRYYVGTPRGLGDLGSNEWEDLIYRVHRDDPTNTHWEVFTNANMNIGLDDNDNPIIGDQTIISDTDGLYYSRGATALTSKELIGAGGVNNYIAWRPLLILIGVKNLGSLNVVNLELGHPVPVINHTSLTQGAVRKMMGIKASLSPDKITSATFALTDVVRAVRAIGTLYQGGAAAAPVFSYSTIQNALMKILQFKVDIIPRQITSATYALTNTVKGVRLLHAYPGGGSSPVVVLPTTLNTVKTIKSINFKTIGVPDKVVYTGYTMDAVRTIRKPSAFPIPIPLSLLH